MKSTNREYWDEVAEEWTSSHPQQLWRQHSDAVNSALLRRWLPESDTGRLLKTDMFDEVVSAGLYPVLAARAGLLTGIDLSPGIVEATRRRYPDIELYVADVRKLPFEDHSFDTIVSISTLDHFDSQEHIRSSLAQLARVLRPGGRMVLTLDNLRNPVIWLRSILPDSLLLRLRLVPYRVGRTCGPRRLVSYCQDAGLTVEAKTAIMHCPRVLAVAFARLLVQKSSGRMQEKYLRSLRAFENLERWPTRYLSGHFTALLVRKPLQQDPEAISSAGTAA